MYITSALLFSLVIYFVLCSLFIFCSPNHYPMSDWSLCILSLSSFLSVSSWYVSVCVSVLVFCFILIVPRHMYYVQFHFPYTSPMISVSCFPTCSCFHPYLLSVYIACIFLPLFFVVFSLIPSLLMFCFLASSMHFLSGRKVRRRNQRSRRPNLCHCIFG